MLYESEGQFITARDSTKKWTDQPGIWTPALRPVWENGKLLIDEDFATIRNRSE